MRGSCSLRLARGSTSPAFRLTAASRQSTSARRWSRDYPDEHFDQVFTSCTFCSVPDPIAGLAELRRVLRTGGDLYMFEHTGSRWFPFSVMMDLMTPLTSRVGPDMNRRTVDNVRAAGFELKGVYNVYLDVVKTIHAVRPAA
jgi:ubiquinone/menaquinone biosynthesis C-methylase UbiE